MISMEAKINIANILKNKPVNMKLYSPLFGDVFLKYIGETFITVRHHGKTANFYHNGRLYDYEGAEPVLFPSREMRDWSKFARKKGDVLINNSGFKIFFDKWANENYTKFLGKIKLLGDSHCYDTAYYNLVSEEEALEFIKSVEKINNGKLNRETLKIENTQLEFKDGDMVSLEIRYIDSEDVIVETYIVHDDYNYGEELNFYVGCNDLCMIRHNSCVKPTNTSVRNVFIRYATDSEKKQLFDTLAKEGKAWDANKKIIVDLNPKIELKPFDKVLVRNDKEDQWSANIFSYQVRDMYHCLGECYWRYCIPYEGNEHLLGTTNNMED